MNFTRADMLAAVDRSPEAVASHDREGWLQLFSSDAVIEDPVGTRPHRGRAEISGFYDTFIATRDITFHPDADVIVGSTVIRDVELEITMAPDVTLHTPAYLRYDLREDGSGLKIVLLQAFWELPMMVGQLLRNGVSAMPAGVVLSRTLLANQGLAGAAGFLGGFRGAGTDGKRRFTKFLDDARTGDEVAVRRGLAKGAGITTGDDRPLGAAELLRHLAGARWRKLISSGWSMATSVERDGQRAVLIADVAAKPFAVRRIRLFLQRDG
jgi:hypothetical protein